jgi:hypothetical protein
MSNYTAVTDTAVACASNAAKTVIGVIASSSKKVKLKEFGISFDGVDATKTPVRVDIYRGSADGTGTSQTIRAEDPTNETVLGTAKVNYTVEPAGTNVNLRSWYITPAGGLWVIQNPLGDEQVFAVSTMLFVRTTTVTGSGTPNCIAYLSFAE